MARPNDPGPTYVLLVGPDTPETQETARFLAGRGVEVTRTHDARDARELVAHTAFDVAVLDSSDDHHATMRLLTELAGTQGIAVLVGSQLSALPDCIEALEHGADDYLRKPVDPHELLARLRAVHRRCQRARPRFWHQKRVSFGGWTLDLDSRNATHTSGQRTQLTEGEFHLLRALLEHAGEALTRDQLTSMTHRDSSEVFDRSIDVLVGRLRAKLEGSRAGVPLIQTVRGQGYRLQVAAAWE